MIYEPEQWHDFFVMVGGGTAALAGLVFVAMSINLEQVTRDATHLNRAIGTLTGFSYAFILCGLALIGGQDHRLLGGEWLVLAGGAAYVYLRGYILALRQGGRREALSQGRVVFGMGCYLAQIVGAVMLMLGNAAGLQLAAAGMMLFFASLISGAWLLLVGIYNEKKPTQR
jgi:hypothetical protein